MIDYAAIADAAQVYPDYQTAFNAMSVEMGENTFRDLSPNSLKMWAATFPEDFQTLHTGTDTFSILAVSMISGETTPLFLSDSNIHSFVNALPISQAAIDGAYAMATKINKTWPNLVIASVKKAFEMRTRGEI